jgi:CRISPR/Cas system-associated exonuclease Cas4 (RecB family)
MVSRAQARAPLPGSRSARPECEIKLPHGRVKLTLDHTELVDEGGTTLLLVQRLRTGKPSKSEAEKPIYGLYQAASEQEHPEAERRVQILYLSTNEVKDVALNKKQVDKRLEEYDGAIFGILSGQFHPEPSDRECPRCPHYHICPLAEDDPA